MLTTLGPARVVKLTSEGAMVELDYPSGLTVALDFDGMSPIEDHEPEKPPMRSSRGTLDEVAIVDNDTELEDRTDPSPVPAPSSAVPPKQEVLSDIPAKKPETESVRPATLDTAETVDERQLRFTLNALRFGLVPDRALRDLTIGIKTIEDWIRSRLPEANDPKVSEITGPFGTGKSHTMALVRKFARDAGYVTAHIEVDGKSISFAILDRFLRKLWTTLQFPDHTSSTPVLDLYLGAVRNGKSPKGFKKYGIRRVQTNFDLVRLLHEQKIIDDVTYEMNGFLSSSKEFTTFRMRNKLGPLLGRQYRKQMSIYPMIGNRVDDRPADFCEVLAGHALMAQCAGYRGLIVTIDEFEVEMQFLSRPYRARVRCVFEELARYFSGKSDLKSTPLGLFIASIEDFDEDPDASLPILFHKAKAGHYRVEPMKKSDRHRLGDRIGSVYQRAYSLETEPISSLIREVEEALRSEGHEGSAITRIFVKRLIALLDSKFGPPVTNVS